MVPNIGELRLQGRKEPDQGLLGDAVGEQFAFFLRIGVAVYSCAHDVERERLEGDEPVQGGVNGRPRLSNANDGRKLTGI